MAQLVRAPPCHGGGHGFESRLGRFSNCFTITVWDLSSAGRASALQAEGHRFEPCRSHFIMYQLNMPMWLNWQSSWFVISRLSVRVRSSALYNFILILYYGQIPEWPKGTDCKSAATCFDGSNPSLPITLYRVKILSRDGAVWKLAGLITRRS